MVSANKKNSPTKNSDVKRVTNHENLKITQTHRHFHVRRIIHIYQRMFSQNIYVFLSKLKI